MLKNRIKNKKGFTLVEILVAVSILGIIVGPLLISLFSNNNVIEQARKETEATYVAKKVMEETLADYYSSISGTQVDTTVNIGGVDYPTYVSKLITLLDKSSTGNSYTSTEGYKSKYADKFTYDIKIVPSGKNGLGVSDSSANYLHIYTDKVGTQEYSYIVAPDGTVKKVILGSSESSIDITKTGSGCSVVLNSSSVLNNTELNASKSPFRVVCYSSNDATAHTIKFDASTSWPSTCERYLMNYTSRADSTKTTVSADPDFISSENKMDFYTSEREQWDIALYEITVTVYEGVNVLSSAESVIEVKIFP